MESPFAQCETSDCGESVGGIPLAVPQEKIDWLEALPEIEISRPEKPPAKKPAKRGSWYGIVLLVLIFGIIGAIGAGRIYLSIVMNAQMKTLQKEISELKIQNDLYQVEVDKLRAVSRIETLALEMGMEKPSGMVYVVGNVAVAQSRSGVSFVQTVPKEMEAVSAETEPSKLQQISQFFTGFFASTQY